MILALQAGGVAPNSGARRIPKREAKLREAGLAAPGVRKPHNCLTNPHKTSMP